VHTIAATTNRNPRVALIAVVALVAAFALLMVVRSGVIGGSDSGGSATTKPLTAATPATGVAAPAATTPAARKTPKVVLLPDLPASVAHALRYSKVTVVSVYVGQAAGDRPFVLAARKGARAAGANFVAVNVGSDKQAATITKFAGTVSSPTTLVVRRPGKIVTQLSGPVDTTVVQQAAHNAGARR